MEQGIFWKYLPRKIEIGEKNGYNTIENNDHENDRGSRTTRAYLKGNPQNKQ
jgi:hypothetical protein